MAKYSTNGKICTSCHSWLKKSKKMSKKVGFFKKMPNIVLENYINYPLFHIYSSALNRANLSKDKGAKLWTYRPDGIFTYASRAMVAGLPKGGYFIVPNFGSVVWFFDFAGRVIQ